ncbi:MAG: long-chain fatty acid--CoA ligase, partial [Actinobacteria bacterium]|nr:long-chain fatty acid--CoA ligase [Actinomycetota bacterium]
VARDAGIRIANGLGSSELTNMYLSDRPHAPRPGTVGWPVPGYEVQIDGRRALPGDAGELWVRGPTMFAGYLGDPAATDALLRDGWFRTGDRVRMEADRSYTFLGRMGDVLKVGGLWVDPARVQDVLLGDPAVADAVVVAAPDADDVQRLVAVVGSSAPAAEVLPRLHAHMAAALDRHTIPRAVVVVEHLPVTPSGKVRRDLVMQMARDGLARGEAA